MDAESERAELEKALNDEPYIFHEGCDEFELVDEIVGDQRRWSQMHTHILKSPTGRYWKLTRDVGLTENQDDGPTTIVGEVTLTETTRTIVEKKWTNV
jgi:hypothetical protein